MILVTNAIALQENEIEEEFIRASGPGGQNVNKVASAVQLRFNVRNSPSLPAEVKQRLMRLAGKRLTAEGVLLIKAQQFRTQERNRQAAREQLCEMIRQATQKPKVRRKTKPTAASQQRRIEAKKRRGETKQMRRAVPHD